MSDNDKKNPEDVVDSDNKKDQEEDNVQPDVKVEQEDALKPETVLEVARHNEEVLAELSEKIKETQLTERQQQNILEEMQASLKQRTKEFEDFAKNIPLNRRQFTLGTFASGILGGAVAMFAESLLGEAKDKYQFDFLPNPEGVIKGRAETGFCSFAGAGTRTPYDLSITNVLAQAHKDLNYNSFGFCYDVGGSIGNFGAALATGYEGSIATGQRDVYVELKKQGKIADLKELFSESDERFETALIATSRPDFKTLSDIHEAVKKATPDAPLRIGVPPDGSGSFFTAMMLVKLGVLGREGAYWNDRIKFVHYADMEEMAQAVENKRVSEDNSVDVSISVQYPGKVDGDYRSMRKTLQKRRNIDLVDITPQEFHAGFDKATEYGYTLRRGWVDGKAVNMLGVSVVVASRDPETIENQVIKPAVKLRNQKLRAYFNQKSGQGALDFEPYAQSRFPIIELPAGSLKNQRKATPQPK